MARDEFATDDFLRDQFDRSQQHRARRRRSGRFHRRRVYITVALIFLGLMVLGAPESGQPFIPWSITRFRGGRPKWHLAGCGVGPRRMDHAADGSPVCGFNVEPLAIIFESIRSIAE